MKKKKLVPFRLFDDDLEKFRIKTAADRTNMQRVFEILIKKYLENNEHIMNFVKSVQKGKYARARRYNEFSELEASALYHRISEISPIAETERILKELEEEEKE